MRSTQHSENILEELDDSLVKGWRGCVRGYIIFV